MSLATELDAATKSVRVLMLFITVVGMIFFGEVCYLQWNDRPTFKDVRSALSQRDALIFGLAQKLTALEQHK